jgi:hypothetical protein
MSNAYQAAVYHRSPHPVLEMSAAFWSGKSVRSFDKSGVIFASLGPRVTDVRQTSIKASFAIVINEPFD